MVKTQTDWKGTQRTLWFGAFGGLAAWIIHLAVGFVLIYDGCALGSANIRLYVGAATLILGLVAAVAAWVSYRTWRRLPEASSGAAPPWVQNGRDRFMAQMGIWLSLLALLIMVLLALPIAWLNPCR